MKFFLQATVTAVKTAPVPALPLNQYLPPQQVAVQQQAQLPQLLQLQPTQLPTYQHAPLYHAPTQVHHHIPAPTVYQPQPGKKLSQIQFNLFTLKVFYRPKIHEHDSQFVLIYECKHFILRLAHSTYDIQENRIMIMISYCLY